MCKVLFVVAILLWSTGAAAQQASVSFEPDTDRPGQNLRVLDLEKADPSLCAQACVEEPLCLSFTYVKPGIQGPKARCWLKSGVPAPQKGTCCVSGVKTAGPAAGKPPTPMKAMPGTIQVSPKPPEGAPTRPQEAGRPAVSPDKEIEAKMKMLPPSAREPVKPLTRAELVNVLLANPQVAPRLQQMASTFGMPAQQLATRSTSGKVVKDVPRTVPPTGPTSNLDWEAGVRFTPRSSDGEWEVTGVKIFKGQGNDYGLSDMYQRDELLLMGDTQDVQVWFSIFTPPGNYIVTVEFASTGGRDDLTFDCSGCGWHSSGLVPVLDKQAIINQQISTYIGQFQVDKSGVTNHRIRFPGSGIGIFNYVTGIFRGITFTRF